jgi:hypothetical protein
MKICIPLLVIAALAVAEIQAGEPPVFKPTWSVDAHDPPVYASPTDDSPPAAGHFTNVIVVPAITNWPATNRPHPHMTNWPATNLPSMTNPPALHPPGGR